MNPKSIKMGELYGQFDEITHEWTDGLLPRVIRDCIADTSADKKWIIFDGPGVFQFFGEDVFEVGACEICLCSYLWVSIHKYKIFTHLVCQVHQVFGCDCSLDFMSISALIYSM